MAICISIGRQIFIAMGYKSNILTGIILIKVVNLRSLINIDITWYADRFYIYDRFIMRTILITDL